MYFNTLDFPFHANALFQVWLNLSQLLKRRLEVEIVKHVKIVKDKQTDGHMDGQEIIRKAHQKL